jgi:hypothetical protein
MTLFGSILFGTSAALAQEPADPGDEPAYTSAIVIRWIGDPSSGFALDIDSVEPLTWSVRIQARLGAIRTEWTQGPVAGTAEGTVEVALEPPASAWLHELAADYVTDLAVTVLGVDASGQQVIAARAPAAFLVWPEGRAGAPVVWDVATMRTSAPAGVVSDALRATLGDLAGVDRIGPPIYAVRSFTAEDLAEGGE